MFGSLKNLLKNLKDLLQLVAISVVLPTVDAGTDVAQIVQLILASHYFYGTAFLVPFMANYLANLYDVISTEKENKMKKLLAALINCFPQYRAGEIIATLWGDPKKGSIF